MELSIPLLGMVNFEPAPDGHWPLEFDYAGHPVKFDFNVERTTLTQNAVDTVARFLTDLATYDEVARAAIRNEHDRGSEYSVKLYVDHHLEEFDATELRQCFGTDDRQSIDAGLFLSKLRLRRIGLYPDDADERAVFDYTISEDLTDYLIVVRFDARGQVVAVETES